MAIQKRFYNENQENSSYLRIFLSEEQTLRIVTENDREIESVIDLDETDLKHLMNELNRILFQMKEVSNG